uniref:FAD-binding protein n=1 Tax=Volvariella volvacea TaxID=36659 RepID=M9Z6A8_9AGAR|nr:FAD-binding protein [Volvariella volvacea]
MRLLLLALTAAAVQALPRPGAECCALLHNDYPDKVSFPGSSEYMDETQAYWSSSCIVSPACFFVPDITSEVSQAVKLLATNNCRFSVRAGGHHSSIGAASNHKGVVISMANFKQRDVDPANNVIRVGPGNRIHEIYAATDAYRKVPVIGRHAQVGTGLLLGAGLSYLNNQEGLSVDNVVAHEVVLADGSVVVASRDSHADLHQALKGGGDNFGIVTRYDLKLFDLPESFLAGVVTYGDDAIDSLDDLTYDYHMRVAKKEKLTHILPQWGFHGANRQREAYIPFLYLKNEPQLPASLQHWLDVPFVHNTIRNTSTFAPLSFENDDGFGNGDFHQQRTLTIYPDRAFFKQVSRLWHEFSQTWQHIEGFYSLHGKMPITPYMVQKGIENGGNVLGLEGIKKPVSIFYFDVACNYAHDTRPLFEAIEAFVDRIRELARKRGLLHPYVMWNYAAFNQRVVDSYGPENVSFLKGVSKKYDPDGIFQSLVADPAMVRTGSLDTASGPALAGLHVSSLLDCHRQA